MAVVRKSKNQLDSNDITRNLPTLQFSHALTEEEKNLMILRKRSHALTVAACANATYAVPILNETRQICAQLKHPEGRKVGRLMADPSLRNPLLIGIIGCGRLGSHLANCLLTFGEVNPEEIKISTRRPETLTELQEKGIKCMYDNKVVANSCHLLILCMLPSQLPAIAEEIKDHISPLCLVYSMVSAMPVSRIRQLLGTDSVIRPEYKWDVGNADRSWDLTLDVSAVFALPELVELTCPLSFNKEEAIVETDSKFAEAIIYALCNVCRSLRLNREETLGVINAVVLGDDPKEPISQKLKMEDITRILTKDKYFPKFDLCAIIGRETPLTQPLNYSRKIRQSFIEKYGSIFSQYLNWKKRDGSGEMIRCEVVGNKEVSMDDTSSFSGLSAFRRWNCKSKPNEGIVVLHDKFNATCSLEGKIKRF